MKRMNACSIIRPAAALLLAALVTQTSLAAHGDVSEGGERASAVDSQPLHPDAVVGAQGAESDKAIDKWDCAKAILKGLFGGPIEGAVAGPVCYLAYALSKK